MNTPAKPRPRFQPQLHVVWEKRSRALLGNLRACLGPRARPTTGRLLFYDFWRGKGFPARSLVISLLIHVTLLVMPLPSWRSDAQAAESPRETDRLQLTWFGPARDLPPIAPREAAPREAAERPAPAPAGQPTVIHPRQTILSTPMRPNHPRQTLFQPDAPPAPPKILPPLPNIMRWSAAPNAPRPKPVITPLDITRARRTRAQAPTEELPIPAAPNSEIRAGDINIAASAPVERPLMPVSPMRVPNPGQRRAAADTNAPEITAAPNLVSGNGDGLPNLIALSADPAPPAPNLEIPLGNLSARFAAAPSVQGNGEAGAGSGRAGAGDGGSGTGDSNSSGTGGGAGPPGIMISGGNVKDAAPVAGPPSATLPPRPLPSRPEPRGDSRSDLRLPRPGLAARPLDPRSSPSLDPGYSSPAAEPIERLLGAKRIYTLHINMPNLTSAAGSWILRFAELHPEPESAMVDLTAPMPVRKVDPRYPPVLIEQRIEGEVRLYAIIRADGSVDSIQVVRSVHPDLDRHSVDALAKWKFRPAGRNGTPVDVEAVVSIPFRLRLPL